MSVVPHRDQTKGRQAHTASETKSNGGPQRKYYRPSREGRRALREGVAEWRVVRDALDVALGERESVS